MARETTIITSIGSDTNESVTIDSVSWSTDSGTITLSATVPAAVMIGDVIEDSATNAYLITGISGADLICQDFETTTDPATGAATVTEGYADPLDWEADLDAGVNSEAYVASDDAQGECYANAAFDVVVIINGGGSVGLSSVLLTVPASERHDGTEGSGARFVRTTVGTSIDSRIVATLKWLEIDQNGVATGGGVNLSNSNLETRLSNYIIHGVADSGNNAFGVRASGDIMDNLFVYDIFTDGTSGSSVKQCRGIQDAGESGQKFEVYNSTIHDVINDDDHASSHAACVTASRNASNRVIKNVIGTDPGGTTSGSKFCFGYSGTATVGDYNLSSDDTADDAGESNNIINKASSAQYVSNSAPYDLHLKSGADAFEAGVNLGTTPVGVEVDIDGYDRDAGGTTTSMGAHDGDNLRGAGPSGTMRLVNGGLVTSPLLSGLVG